MLQTFDKSIDYFALLGVHFDADETIVKKGYRKMARRYHPDVSQLDDATSRFQEVANAYEVLTKFRDDYVRARKTHLTTEQWVKDRREREASRPQSHSRNQQSQTQSQQSANQGYNFYKDYQRHTDSSGHSSQNQSQNHRQYRQEEFDFDDKKSKHSSDNAHSDTIFGRRLAPIDGKDRVVEYPLTLRYAIRLLKNGVFHLPGLQVQMRFDRRALEGKRFRLSGLGYKGLFGGKSGDFIVKFDVKVQTERFHLNGADIIASYQVPEILLTEGNILSLDSPAGRIEWAVETEKLKQQPVVFKGLGLPEDRVHPAGNLLATIQSY